LDYGVAQGVDDSVMFWMKLSRDPREYLKKFFAGYEWQVMAPVLPVIGTREKKEQIFDSFTSWRAIAEEQEKDLYEVVIEYEKRASGWSREKIIDYMKLVSATMHRQTHAVYEEEPDTMETPFTGYHFRKCSIDGITGNDWTAV